MITLKQLTVIFWAGCNSTLDTLVVKKRTDDDRACLLPLGKVGRAGLPVPVSRTVFFPVTHTAGKPSDAKGHIGHLSLAQEMGLPCGTPM